MTNEFEKKKQREYLEQAKFHIDLAQGELDDLKDATNRCDFMDTLTTFKDIYLNIHESQHYLGKARPSEETVIELGKQWDRLKEEVHIAIGEMPCEIKKLTPTT